MFLSTDNQHFDYRTQIRMYSCTNPYRTLGHLAVACPGICLGVHSYSEWESKV